VYRKIAILAQTSTNWTFFFPLASGKLDNGQDCHKLTFNCAQCDPEQVKGDVDLNHLIVPLFKFKEHRQCTKFGVSARQRREFYI
jgi:hypothetical protein